VRAAEHARGPHVARPHGSRLIVPHLQTRVSHDGGRPRAPAPPPCVSPLSLTR
jgi:hypothetical protein